VFKVSNEAGAAITTARYYTPSGRLIQRPWDGTFDEYLTYTLREQNADQPHRAEDLKHTDSGRRVYSGGGIEPDRRFDGPVMGFDPTRFGRTLYARSLFASFGERFSREGDTRIAPRERREARELTTDFEVTDALLREFRQHVEQANVRIDEAAWAADEAFIRAMLRFEIDLDLFGVSEAWQNLVRQDPQLQIAVSAFPEAVSLLETSRRRDGGPRAGR
jgi:carboxyl-terminal processing protease